MRRGSEWRRLLRLSLGKRSVERDVSDELAFHIAMREEKLRRLGLAPEAAQERARQRFGDPAKVRDECITIDTQYAREVRFMEWLESLWSDVRYAMRTLRRSPAFTIVATLTLALGIGATTAMFTLVDGILLRPLPFPEPERIVRVIQSYPEKGLDTWGLSQQNAAMYRDGARDFAAFAAMNGRPVTLTGPERSERLSTARVTADFFKVVGVHPARGREFFREEDAPGRNNVVILSHAFWQTRFGGDTTVLGRALDLDGRPTTVVGIMPRGFAFPRPDVQVWIPVGLDPSRRFGFFFAGIARLKPGVTVEHAEQETTRIMWDWARREQALPNPERTRMKTIVEPLHESMTGSSARPLTILLAAVSLILLIAIANVATLLSTRAAARSREIGLRVALGATRRRVVRQLLTESIGLALLGAVLGVLFAVGSVRAFTHSSLAALPRIEEVSVNGRVLAFTLIVSVASGVLFGLLPALHSARSRFTADLSSGGVGRITARSRRINNALVVTQLALSVVLLVSAGLVVKSFRRLVGIDLGFRPENVTVVQLPLPQGAYDQRRTMTFIQTLLEQVRAVPAVRSASLSWYMPYDGNTEVDGYLVEGRPVPSSGAEAQSTQIAVSPGYFATLGIPLRRGRDFTFADDSAAIPVVIVDDEMVRRHWPNGDAIGKRVRPTGDTTWLTIVGVVGSTRDEDAATEPRPHMYIPLSQTGGSIFSLAVHSATDLAAIVPSLRRTIAQIEPAIPVDAARPLTALIGQSLDNRRLIELLLGAFALLAVALAGVGIYGVMSLYVANRRREFGIRLAIGAAPGSLVRLVLGEGAVLTVLGIALGIGGALLASRWIQSLLYAVSPTDPVVFGSLAATLAVIAIASCWMPAMRAAKSDPLQVLRSD